eukprot:CAMPEP_0170176504 /NCGR_PEP_ID=MMETSP0040_2-20121228/9370_1 /TAXON_ID=641309 /ORGANISM="Lotharella oceanica, Strain CCMP622" /LENGTH=111 /DNA_ID=CAMNT_0010418851 /DNA_START=158 /DNA_END=493 /DNA_ORIENTATION=+
MKFLGGFNLALAVLAAVKLYRKYVAATRQRRLGRSRDDPSKDDAGDDSSETDGLVCSAVAHATQFAFNIPHVGGVKAGAPWNVLEGLMCFIFVTDFVGAALNTGAALYDDT